MIGWHKDSIHHFLSRHGDKIIPNFSSSLTGNICEMDGDMQYEKRQVRVFVPLCGKTVDMAFLAENKRVEEVVGIDSVRVALENFSIEHPSLDLMVPESSSPPGPGDQFECLKGKKISLLLGNIFDLNDIATNGRFDAVFDRASLVAIQPGLREKYVETIGKLMKPGGRILLVTVDRRTGTEDAKSTGPPFSVDEKEVYRLYNDLDWVESVSMIEEVDEFVIDPESKERWEKRGLDSLFEICFLIKVKE